MTFQILPVTAEVEVDSRDRNGWNTAMQRVTAALKEDGRAIGADSIVWNTLAITTERRIIQSQALTARKPRFDVRNIMRADALAQVPDGEGGL